MQLNFIHGGHMCVCALLFWLWLWQTCVYIIVCTAVMFDTIVFQQQQQKRRRRQPETKKMNHIRDLFENHIVKWKWRTEMFKWKQQRMFLPLSLSRSLDVLDFIYTILLVCALYSRTTRIWSYINRVFIVALL